VATTADVLRALHATKYVRGYTHPYYRYPAATNPDLVRELVAAFTDPGDVVCDPFMGGGTVAVESLAAARRFIGSDLNELAVFVSRAKTTPLSERSWDAVIDWARNPGLFRDPSSRFVETDAHLPPLLQSALASARERALMLTNLNERRMALCALLRLGQWALEARIEVPQPPVLQDKLGAVVSNMWSGMQSLTTAAIRMGASRRSLVSSRSLRCCSASQLATDRVGRGYLRRVKLVVTSPPYPGVHVLYHRWQVQGRRETRAPYWLIGAQDGHFMPYYTMGGRSHVGRLRYFDRLHESFAALRPLLAHDARIAIVVGFPSPDHQEQQFRDALNSAGYERDDPEAIPSDLMVRDVPNRRWYVRVRGKPQGAAREVLMLFRPVY
jgi:hypothetical protein